MDHMDHVNCSCHAAALGRRHFIGLAGMTGAALLAGGLVARPAAAADTDALLLNCIDYRLTGKITEYMAKQGMEGKYDQFSLAGASLGAVTHKFPDWGRAFRQHLQVAIDLHRIHQVVVIDHRDCGAYKVILGRDDAGNPDAETKIHTEMLHKVRAEIHHLHPKLEIRLGLMALDGSVADIA